MPPRRKLKRGTRVRIRTQLPVQQRNMYKYYPLTPEIQQQACRHYLGVQFVCDNGCAPGGPNVAVTNPRSIQVIQSDGNCLFRAFSYVITGSESQHYRIRCLIVEHLRSLVGTESETKLLNTTISNYDSIDDYIGGTRMEQDGKWGTNVEMVVLAHLLNFHIASFDVTSGSYSLWGDGNYLRPSVVFTEDCIKPTIFIYWPLSRDHYNVILSQE